ncbi:formate dehydrogenase accessory protein FdhE [Zoogloea sp.]|uniref:formate dehydrogenase accessory protein FdhE n=1 Tax=Zoogloea sp. TaxID=49181 RepID=UPI001AD569E9|nr:formate dehydrogenase accessory protein FdhE [Zoogloea sp.]MBN8282192.1 formate dehydrogenase accessory protein FdhE [Zoogloea sp.]
MNLTENILPSSIAPATLLLPGPDLFGVRAARLRHLAHGHGLAPWLNGLADVCDAQQMALNTLPALIGLPSGDAAGPPLAGHQAAALWQALPAVVHQLFTASRGLTIPPAREPGAEALQRMAQDGLKMAVGEVATGQRDAASILVAAALQVVWTAAARTIALSAMTPLQDLAPCPCCGSAPVGAVVMAGEGKGGLRYLECSLCATRWNAVRARCTLCEEGSVVQYLGLEGASGAVQAEACDHCGGYIKTFFQDKDIQIDPLADDLGSLTLDILVGEQGYARAAPNLFLQAAEPVRDMTRD